MQDRNQPRHRRSVLDLLRRRISSIATANQRAATQSRRRIANAGNSLRQWASVPGAPRPQIRPIPKGSALTPIEEEELTYATSGAPDNAPTTALALLPQEREPEDDRVDEPDFVLPPEKTPYLSFLTARPDAGRYDGSFRSAGAADSGGTLTRTVPIPIYDPNRRSTNSIFSKLGSERKTRRFGFTIRNRPAFMITGLFALLMFFGLVMGLLYLNRFFQAAPVQKFVVVYSRLGEGSNFASSPEASNITKDLSNNFLQRSGVPASDARISDGVLKDQAAVNSEIKRVDGDLSVWGYYDPPNKLLNLTLTLQPNGPLDPPGGMGYRQIKQRLYDPDSITTFVVPASADIQGRHPLTVLLSGLYQYYSGGYEQAVAEFTTLIRVIDPVNLPAMYLLRGNALFAYGKYDEAIKDYDKLLSLTSEAAARQNPMPIDPAFVLNNRAVASSFLPNGYNQAMKDLQEAMQRDTEQGRAKVNYVALQLDRPGATFTTQQLNDNLKLLEATAKQNPSLPNTYYYMGRIYDLEGNFDKAIESYKKSQELDNQEAGLYRELGWAYLNTGRDDLIEPARATFQQGLDLAQRQAQESRDYAASLVAQNVPLLGRVWQNRAQNLDNVTDDLKYGLARIFFEKGLREGNQIGNPFDRVVRWAQQKKTSLEEARDRLVDVISARPNFADPYLYLGQTMELLGEGDAASQYNKAKDLAKNDPNKELAFAQSLASFYLRQGRVNEAVSQYNDYVHRYPNSFLGHQLLARLYVDIGQFEKGLSEAQNALKIAPNAPTQANLADAYLVQGRALIGLKRPNEALSSIDQSLKLKPDNLDARFYRGNALYDLGRFEEARQEYNFILKVDNNTYPEAHYRLGVLYMDKLNDPKSAHEQLETAIRLNPGLSDAHLRLGELYSRDNSTLDQAINAYTDAIKYNGNNATAYYYRGLLLENKDKLVEAEADFRRALELQPGLVNARQHLGLVLLREGKGTEALQEIQTAATQDRSSSEIQTNLADIYRLGGDYNKAVSIYTEALRLKATNQDALYGRALAFYNLTRYDAGIADADRLVTLNPKYPGALVLDGKYQTQTGRLDEALKSFEQARQLNPNDAEVYTGLGVIYMQRSQPDLAFNSFNQAVQLDPNEIDAHFWLGALYNGQSQRDKAIAEYEKTVQLKPDWALAWRYLGDQYAAKGDFDTAIQKYNIAIQKSDKQIEAFYQRGNAYRAKGQRQQAQDDYDRALALNQNYAPALLQKAITYEEVGDTGKARDFYNRAAKAAQPSENDIKLEAQRSLTRIGP